MKIPISIPDDVFPELAGADEAVGVLSYDGATWWLTVWYDIDGKRERIDVELV